MMCCVDHNLSSFIVSLFRNNQKKYTKFFSLAYSQNTDMQLKHILSPHKTVTYCNCIGSLVVQHRHHGLAKKLSFICTARWIHRPESFYRVQGKLWVTYWPTLAMTCGQVLTSLFLSICIIIIQSYTTSIGNSRGNVYSTDHISLDPNGSRKQRSEFWSHSFHEIGYYDVPASIDFVLGKTNQMKLQFIGHSQGAAAFFVMASERPEYNDKIAMMHALAPAVYLSHCKTPFIRAVTPFLDILIVSNSTLCITFSFHFL